MDTKKQLSTRAFGTSLDNGRRKKRDKGGKKRSLASVVKERKDKRGYRNAVIHPGAGRGRSAAGEKRVTRSVSRARATHRNEISDGAMVNVEDIDATEEVMQNPLAAAHVVKEIFATYRAKESSLSARPTYMAKQTHINERMRTIVVDWIVDVHRKFRFVPETLYLTVNLIDRYLSVKEVERPMFQLVAVSCLLIASKYEEIYQLPVNDLVFLCAETYTRQDILDMEWAVLTELDFKIYGPTAHPFLVRFLRAANADTRTTQLASFLLDGTLQNYQLLQYRPSQLAAAAVMIARRTNWTLLMGKYLSMAVLWTPTLAHYTDYSEEEVMPVARAILGAWDNRESSCSAVKKKYSATGRLYGGVALVALPSADVFSS